MWCVLAYIDVNKLYIGSYRTISILLTVLSDTGHNYEPATAFEIVTLAIYRVCVHLCRINHTKPEITTNIYQHVYTCLNQHVGTYQSFK